MGPDNRSNGLQPRHKSRSFYWFLRWMLALTIPISLLLLFAGSAQPARAGASTTLYFPLVFSKAVSSSSNSLPDPSRYEWRTYVSGLDTLTGMAVAGDGSGRLFVTEKAGRIRVIKNGVLLPTPFLDLTDRVTSAGGEQGLLGLAFDPNYASNGRFYVDYTGKTGYGDTAVSRFTRSAGNPDLADPSSEQLLLPIVQPNGFHNGGDLGFGPDGYLYISVGDGGPGGDPQNRAQSLDTLHGKILRINVSGTGGYTIPPSNPFVGTAHMPEIWAYGLRNPWRFSFDRLTGDLFIADVGQAAWEEVNFQAAGSKGGQNYGWRYLEGTHPYLGTPPQGLKLVKPIFEYDHNIGCAVTGGYVYRGQALREWEGVYLFGDFCSGRVWALKHKSNQWLSKLMFTTGASITSFGQDESGELYLLDRAGSVLKLVAK